MLLVEKLTTDEDYSKFSQELDCSIKVQQIRWQLMDGIYPIESHLEQALDRVLEDLLD